jgi:beta-lactamase class D
MDDFITQKIFNDQSTEMIQPMPPLTRDLANWSVTSFMYVLSEMLRVDRPDIDFTPAYPGFLLYDDARQRWIDKQKDNPTELFKPTITYKIMDEEAGGLAGNKDAFGGIKQYNTALVQTAEAWNNRVETRVRFYDTIVEFEIWDITHLVMDELYEWFRRYLTIMRDFFKHVGGIVEIAFWKGGYTSSALQSRNKLNRRELQFYIRTQEIYERDPDGMVIQEVRIRTAANKVLKK